MSNALSVRRVQFQDIHEDGKPEGEPTFGIIASDSYAMVVTNIYPTLSDLNAAIEEAGCILKVVDPEGDNFPEANYEKIGKENYYGKDWTTNDPE